MNNRLPVPILIADESLLAQVCLGWQQCSALALDTEFVRTDTFYAKLGLIQVSDGMNCWLIDPLTIEDFSPLIAIMQSPQIVKVFHATSEDLEILQQALGCIPEPLFDTQVAAALTGFGFSRGYAALVDVLLAIKLDKHETRSDWTRRPLSDAQLGYAAEDVYYLASIYSLLKQRLEEAGRTGWMAEEMQALLDKVRQPEDIDQYYLRVKAAWQLEPQGLALLQQLCQWREQEARLCNKPRNRVVSDKVLLEIAICKPGNRQALKDISDMHPRTLRVYGERLLALVESSSSIAENDCPPPVDQPLPREVAASIKKLKTLVNEVAEKLDLPPEVLAKKRDIEALMRSVREDKQPELPKILAQGWRFEVVGQPLLTLAESL